MEKLKQIWIYAIWYRPTLRDTSCFPVLYRTKMDFVVSQTALLLGNFTSNAELLLFSGLMLMEVPPLVFSKLCI
jgi:hypothetical protein